MKKIIIILLLMPCLFKGQGQSSAASTWPYDMQQAQLYLFEEHRLDSAVYFISRLAGEPSIASVADDILQKYLPSNFVNDEDYESLPDSSKQATAAERVFLRKFIDTLQSLKTSFLATTSLPLQLALEARDAANDVARLRTITNRFLPVIDDPKYLARSHKATYSLAILDVLVKHAELKELYGQLLTKTMVQVDAAILRTAGRSDRETTLYKFYAAALNFRKGDQAGDRQVKNLCYSTAYEYSPDLWDYDRESSWYYDNFFLTGKEKIDFYGRFIGHLNEQHAGKAELVIALTKVALIHTEYKDTLLQLFDGNKTAFDEFWLKVIDSLSVPAPNFSLYTLDGRMQSTDMHKGKWILLDFWGTWCGPCRQEHPELQVFYNKVIKNNSSRIAMLTIACRDERPKVTAYLKEKTLSFPVAMADKKIEANFRVDSYPSKILISPTGRMLKLPFNLDYRKLIESYAGIR